MTDFDRAWFGGPDDGGDFRLDTDVDIHVGPRVLLVCRLCRPQTRLAAWSDAVDLAYAVSVATDHGFAVHWEAP